MPFWKCTAGTSAATQQSEGAVASAAVTRRLVAWGGRSSRGMRVSLMGQSSAMRSVTMSQAAAGMSGAAQTHVSTPKAARKSAGMPPRMARANAQPGQTAKRRHRAHSVRRRNHHSGGFSKSARRPLGVYSPHSGHWSASGSPVRSYEQASQVGTWVVGVFSWVGRRRGSR